MEHKLTRSQDRAFDQLRAIDIIPDFLPSAEGSVLIRCGQTHIVCSATIEEKVPSFLHGKGQGWVTAEYGMLPRSTQSRMRRESVSGKQGGRTQEIQRLIGRSLRAVIDLKKLGERQIIIDCDVIQADGGTRTASITGGFVALALAIKKLQQENRLMENPILEHVAAISVGVVQGQPLLDLDYQEDSNCDVDMNIVMTSSGNLVEIQGTAEGTPFSKTQLGELLGLGEQGIAQLIALQKQVLTV